VYRQRAHPRPAMPRTVPGPTRPSRRSRSARAAPAWATTQDLVGGAVRVRHQLVNALDGDIRQQVKDRYVLLGNGITQQAEILGDRVSTQLVMMLTQEGESVDPGR